MCLVLIDDRDRIRTLHASQLKQFNKLYLETTLPGKSSQFPIGHGDIIKLTALFTSGNNEPGYDFFYSIYARVELT